MDRLRAFLVAALTVMIAAGCGNDPAGVSGPAASRTVITPPPAVGGTSILYDGRFRVGEGLWWLADSASYDVNEGPGPSFRRLLEADGDASVMITVPNADGRYLARVELRTRAPSVPAWCEDAAEASLRIRPGGGPLEMGTEGSTSVWFATEPGWYRVRYCTELQDTATEEDVVIAERPDTYSGRHLIQLWAAPQAADRTLVLGSDFAQRLAGG